MCAFVNFDQKLWFLLKLCILKWIMKLTLRNILHLYRFYNSLFFYFASSTSSMHQQFGTRVMPSSILRRAWCRRSFLHIHWRRPDERRHLRGILSSSSPSSPLLFMEFLGQGGLSPLPHARSAPGTSQNMRSFMLFTYQT